VRVDFLLGLTFALNLWEWKTWEVVQYLVRPATEGEGRCRFGEIASVRPFTGAATVFISHTWGGRWGDLVAASCTGGDTNRIVWIDLLAVRQWPGNDADLDFSEVIAGCTAGLAVFPLLEGTLTEEGAMARPEARNAFLDTDEGRAYSNVAPTARLWAVVELGAMLEQGKRMVCWCGKAVLDSTSGGMRVGVVRGEKAFNVLENCSYLFDVNGAQCAVAADKERELARIGHANFERMQRSFGAALRAAVATVDPEDKLARPPHIGVERLVQFLPYAAKTKKAARNYEYWANDKQPWRDGTDKSKSPVVDPAMIASEEQHKLAVEASDRATAGTPLHDEKLRCRGIRVDFLLALTFALNMWEWATWEVVQYLVKPATESDRCRFALGSVISVPRRGDDFHVPLLGWAVG
jgi:hypothetical protein